MDPPLTSTLTPFQKKFIAALLQILATRGYSPNGPHAAQDEIDAAKLANTAPKKAPKRGKYK
jgi:hypothetical protein